MAIEFIATLPDGTAGAPLARVPAPEAVLAADPDYPARFAGRYEDAGFDWILIEQSASSPDGFAIASQVLMTTSRIGVLLASPAGAVAPTVAARQYATLDAFYPGRVGLHVRSEPDRGPGDPARRQSAEFLRIVGQSWTAAAPFDYEGEFYQVKGAWSAIRPPAGRVPVYLTSGCAEAAGPREAPADVHVFGCGSPDTVRASISRARAARGHGRPQRFGVAVSGTPAEVARMLPGYVDAGISAVLIHGPGPEDDAPDYGTAIRLARARAAAGRGLVA